MHRRRFLALGASALAAPSLGSRAFAQGAAAFPSRFVRLVVPFTPGGANDVIARLVGGRLSEIWGQQVVVENRPGAGGNLGGELVARADPDGYTIMLNGISHAVNVFLYPTMTVDPAKDFTPISLVCKQPNLMVVPNSSPSKSVGEFIARAKAEPGRLTFASTGLGTSLHLCAELFKSMAGVEMIHVPYRGTSPAMADLIPGRVDVMFNSMGSVLPAVQSGQVRGLAVTTPERAEAIREMPTISEAALPGFDVSSWFAIWAPARTPPEIAARISADTAAALRHPAVKGKLEDIGSVVVGSTPEALGAHLAAEMAKWGPLIKKTGIQAPP